MTYLCNEGARAEIISTHTLTWSVTREGIDYVFCWQFQLTRSRGAWRFSEKLKRTLSNFNSHAHVERDFSAIRLLTVLVLFQLTRSRGAWPQQIWKSVQTFSFQLTRSRGAWPVGSSSVGSSSVISTHTLTWSVTCRFFLCRLFICHFNSHAHVERDSLITFSYFNQFAFQLTRSRGAWRQHHNHSVYD